MSTTAYCVVVFVVAIWTVSGFLVGKYHERFQWNHLIQLGILPKPKKMVNALHEKLSNSTLRALDDDHDDRFLHPLDG